MSADRLGVPMAVHVFLLRGDSILLLRRANTGYEDGNYSVPAGHLEAGEPVTAAAIREACEEVGVGLSPPALSHALVMHRRLAGAERVDFFVTARSWAGEPRNCEPGKCDELLWQPLDELPTYTVPDVRRAIEAFRVGDRFVEFGWD